MDIKQDVLKAIGNTPLIKLRKVSEETGCTILGKAEFMNPGQSVKDRAALYIVKDAIDRGTLKPLQLGLFNRFLQCATLGGKARVSTNGALCTALSTIYLRHQCSSKFRRGEDGPLENGHWGRWKKILDQLFLDWSVDKQPSYG